MLIERQGRGPGKDRCHERLGLGLTGSKWPWTLFDAARGNTGQDPLRRGKAPRALCRLLLSTAGHPAPGRNRPTTWMPSPWPGWSTISRTASRHGDRRHPLTAYFLDNVAEWILELDRGEGIPWKGNYSSWLEQKRTRLQREEKSESKRQRTLQRELEWIRMSPKGGTQNPRPGSAAYEALVSQETGQTGQGSRDLHPAPRPRLGDLVIEAQESLKGLQRPAPHGNLSFSVPPRSQSQASSAQRSRKNRRCSGIITVRMSLLQARSGSARP